MCYFPTVNFKDDLFYFSNVLSYCFSKLDSKIFSIFCLFAYQLSFPIPHMSTSASDSQRVGHPPSDDTKQFTASGAV